MDRRVAVVLYGTPIMELEDALESSFGAAALDRRCFGLKVLVRCSPLPFRRSASAAEKFVAEIVKYEAMKLLR